MCSLTIELLVISCYILFKRVKDGESLTINWCNTLHINKLKRVNTNLGGTAGIYTRPKAIYLPWDFLFTQK